MARKMNRGVFPPIIDSRRFGTLRLEEIPITDESTHRHYAAPDRIVIPTRRVRLDPAGLTLVIWPPQEGVPDTARFVAMLEQRFDEFARGLDRILDESVPIVELAIEVFWQIPGERAPTADALLKAGQLRQLNLNMDKGSHEVQIHDEGDLVGGHDLKLELAADFQPQSAYFDG